MKKLLILLLCISSLVSKSVVSQFEVSFGFFGEIGVADATLKIDGDKYLISILAKSTGFAKVVSGNKQESYVSEGVIEKGLFKPTSFRKRVKNNSKEDFSFYTIDHVKKEVVRNRFIKREGEPLQKSRTLLGYFPENDVLTLFFNLSNYLLELQEKKVIEKLAIGANKKDRLVKIELLDGKERVVAKDLLDLGDSYSYLRITVNQKIFASDKGELIIALGEDYLCEKAILKDVVFFGDIVGEQKQKSVIK